MGSLAAPARVLLVAGCLCGAAAQGQEVGRSTSLSSSVDTLFTYAIDSRKGGRKAGDFVAEVRPGLQLSSRSGRVVGSLSYSLNLAHHSREYDGETVQNRLDASFSAQAVERWLYVDGSANISQQAASAYGQQSVAGSTQDNANRIEVGTVRLSPYVRGVLASAVSYEVRLDASGTNGWHSIAADSSQTGGSVSLSSAVSGTLIGWGLTGSTQTTDFRAGRESRDDRYAATISFNPDADLSLALRAGQESSNVANVQKTTYDNWGGGLTWRPSPRTRAQIDVDERYFGRSHRVLLEHRLASSSVQFSSSRDSSNGAGGSGQRNTLYQVFFAQFASIEPNPAQRETLVRSYLQAQGLDPEAVVSGGFINSAVTVQERHQLTLAYAGRRAAGSVQAFANKTHVIDAAAVAAAAEDVSQWGYLATASYRLSPTANVSLTGSRVLTRATPTQDGNELKSLSVNVAAQLARRVSGSLGARYSVFNSATQPYREAALTAALGLRF